MIELSNVQFRYEDDGFGLSIPSLQIAAGETVALAGPSGCGKTTLLNLLSGILTADAGTLSVAGCELSSLTDADRRAFRLKTVGQVFQEFELLDYLSVRENIQLPFCINPVLPLTSEARAECDRLCESLGLAPLANRPIDRLSHGERQRVAIGRALVTRPRLLLADEPTGNLDPSTRDRIVDLLFAEAQDRNATLILATHDHSLLPRLDRVIDFGSPEESGIEFLLPYREETAAAAGTSP